MKEDGVLVNSCSFCAGEDFHRLPAKGPSSVSSPLLRKTLKSFSLFENEGQKKQTGLFLPACLEIKGSSFLNEDGFRSVVPLVIKAVLGIVEVHLQHRPNSSEVKERFVVVIEKGLDPFPFLVAGILF